MTALSKNTTHFLMCPPRHFAVTYRINPWMDPTSWALDERKLAATSGAEWSNLYDTLRAFDARIDLIAPVPDLPDLVFTANAAVVLDGRALLARFRHLQRRREEPHFEAVFRSLQARGIIDSVRVLPDDVVLEGAGDCVWDASRNLFWMGYGPRSDVAARAIVEETFATDVVALELADDRFYHMDTALCPLPGGAVMFLPQAFTASGKTVIRDRIASDQLIEVSMADAGRLAINAVCVGDAVVSSGCSAHLGARLAERGYRAIAAPLTSFSRSGGGAFCLTLRLDRRSAACTAATEPMAVA